MKNKFNAETMADLRRGSNLNLFSTQDHAIVRQAMGRLHQSQLTIVRLRFWEQNSRDEIASILDLTIQEVETRLKAAFSKLKKACLEDPRFSRNLPADGVAPWVQSG